MSRVFVSYSHLDEAWKDRLVKQLSVLAEVGLDPWDDRRIAAGDDWLPEIEQAIAECDVALLLISANFLTSPFILGKEIPRLLQRRLEDGIRVIPLILSPCQWQRIPWLSSIQGRPKDGKSLSGSSEHDVEVALSDLVGEIYDLSQRLPAYPQPGQPVPPEKIDLQHLPKGSELLLGRDGELVLLDSAWQESGKTPLVELIAPGGVGKTSLIKRWLDNMRADGWRGAQRVFGWSFYSQGTSDDRQASEDPFLNEALVWFGVEVEASLSAHEKGRELAKAITRGRTLLVLDGIEPLQYPPGSPLAGELRAPGLKALLNHLASSSWPGLCLLTSRETLTDLQEYRRSEHHLDGSLQQRNLGNLDPVDGAALLFALGVRRAGAADIPSADDQELIDASAEIKGHALTLNLLGNYLALAFEGDIRKRGQVDFAAADAEQGGHAFRVMAAYERWFAEAGEERTLAALRLLGFFDRPASVESLNALRAEPAITGLTEPLMGLSQPKWRATLKRLEKCGLLLPLDEAEGGGNLDAHPLIREYLATTLREQQPEGWQEGHYRIYQQLKESVDHRPEGLAALQPLYQAVAHGCLAGRYEEVCDEVYIDRILRGTGSDGFYSWKKLGAFGANLGALACFFVAMGEAPWRHPAPSLSEGDQAWRLQEAAKQIRALGPREEALTPMRAGAEMAVKLKDWKNAAIYYSNLSELQLTLGHVAPALADGQRSVENADNGDDESWQMASRTTLAGAQHHHGEWEAAAALFAEAEALQKQWQPQFPLLYSLQGFQYCELLLAGAERSAWRAMLAAAAPSKHHPDLEACDAVAERAAQALPISVRNHWVLTIVLDHLTLAHCQLYRALLQGQSPQSAAEETRLALDGLRAAGQEDFIPRALLTHAGLNHTLGDNDGARADLAEVKQIASRGAMRLYLADYHLHHARLFTDAADDPQHHLSEARKLIEECEYFRRLPELEDAEKALS